MVDSSRDLYPVFKEAYSFHIPESHKAFYSSEDLEKFLRARYSFFEERPAEVKVAVYDPPGDFFWLVNSTIVEVAMPDSPFIIDTILDYLQSREIPIHLLIHPILHVKRSGARLSEMAGDAESFVYIEVMRLPDEDRKSLQRDLTANLTDVRRIVKDFPAMRDAQDTLTFDEPRTPAEGRWIQDHFVYLGMAEVRNGKLEEPFLGLLARPELRRLAEKEIPEAEGPVSYRETRIMSEVNRRRPLYLILMIGKQRTLAVVGHFSRRGESALREYTPFRAKLDEIARDFRQPETSYFRKQMYRVAQILPVGILATRPASFLKEALATIIEHLYTDDVQYALLADTTYQLAWIVAVIPARDRERIPGSAFTAWKEETGARETLQVRGILERNEIFFCAITAERQVREVIKSLEERAPTMFQSWRSRFRRSVARRIVGEKNIQQALARFFRDMSPEYELQEEPEEALTDLLLIEDMKDGAPPRVAYYPKGAEIDRVKIYSVEKRGLAELVPILADFGFTIIGENTFPYGARSAVSFTTAAREADDPGRVRISKVLELILAGELGSDAANALVFSAKLDHRELQLVRAWCAYVLQIDRSMTRASLYRVLLAYPAQVRVLIEFFRARFDQGTTREEDVLRSFDLLRSSQDDLVFRALWNVIRATVRTNFFAGKKEISFKVTSADLPGLARPVPLFEIFVHAHDFEGIHLRGGRVARGGIRWSDRPDDFRTEIHGLMKAQMVKNTIIVPVGSKGGFVLKKPASSPEALKAAGIAAYKRYIGALLDLTDNRDAKGRVVPAAVTRLDSDDPYLVVAADKGTATFSDTANAVAQEKGFWLSDAFASGGQNGYDHKKQGITARGAWESVRRHFYELGIDADKENITIAGIGDMSGDVFGNGLLLSENVRLLAAFNHKYIFLDPDPDPAASFRERKRLFENVLNWDAYKSALISKGGGVFDRSARTIALSKEVREVLGVKAASLPGEELVKAVLKAQVDLLWNGGIGTYVKASNETHYQAGDALNDRVRIDGKELRARVAAEGGNLGFTQAGRVEASNAGVRLNTDAIDNSAGVDMSDHEVNLKILLDGLMRSGQISGESERTKWIRRLEPDMVRLVLRHNVSNNLALSLDERRMGSQFAYFRALIKFLNREGLIQREADAIPFEADLDRMEESGKRLGRPVLAHLLGTAKLYITDVLLASEAFHGEEWNPLLFRYFPEVLVNRFRDAVLAHPLRREIVITEAVNEIINHGGIAFFQRAVMETGRPLPDIAETWMRVSALVGRAEISRIESSEGSVPAPVFSAYQTSLEEEVYRIVTRVLKDATPGLSPGKADAYRKILHELAEEGEARLPREVRAVLRAGNGDTQAAMTYAFRRVFAMVDAFEIFQATNVRGEHWKVSDYVRFVERCRVQELREWIEEAPAVSPWDLRFRMRVEGRLGELTALVMRAKIPVESEVRPIVDEIRSLNAREALDLPALYELLSGAIDRVNTALLSGGNPEKVKSRPEKNSSSSSPRGGKQKRDGRVRAGGKKVSARRGQPRQRPGK